MKPVWTLVAITENRHFISEMEDGGGGEIRTREANPAAQFTFFLRKMTL